MNKKIIVALSMILILSLTACGPKKPVEPTIIDENPDIVEPVEEIKPEDIKDKDLVVEKLIMVYDETVPIKVTISGENIPVFDIYNPDGVILNLDDETAADCYVDNDDSIVVIKNPVSGRYLLKYSDLYKDKITVSSEYLINPLFVDIDSFSENNIKFHIDNANNVKGSFDVVVVGIGENEKTFTQMAKGDLTGETYDIKIDSSKLTDGKYYYSVNVNYSLNANELQAINVTDLFTITKAVQS